MIVTPTPTPAAVNRQIEYLATAVTQLDDATRYAHALRSTQNTVGDWQHVARFVDDQYAGAKLLVEHAHDLTANGGARFKDIDARSAIGDAHLLLKRAGDTDLTPLGRSRAYGRAAHQLVEARDTVRRELDAVWTQLGRNGDSANQYYYSLVGGASEPLPPRA